MCCRRENSYVCNVSNTHFQLSYTVFEVMKQNEILFRFFLITQEGMDDTDQIYVKPL